MNIQKMMKQAQKMQEQLAQTQAELAEKTVEVTTGGGKLTVVANGAGDVISIKISKDIVDPEDVEMPGGPDPGRGEAGHRAGTGACAGGDGEDHGGNGAAAGAGALAGERLSFYWPLPSFGMT